MCIEFFRLPIQKPESIESSFESDIRTDNTDVAAHDILQFFPTLGDEYHFFWRCCAEGIPARDISAECNAIHMCGNEIGYSFSENQAFQQRVGCQSVCAVQSRKSTFTASHQVLYGCFAVGVRLYSSAEIVASRHHGYPVSCGVDSPADTFFVNGRKVRFKFFDGQVRAIQTHEIIAPFFELFVDSSGYNISG